jgi:hypothetical protein
MGTASRIYLYVPRWRKERSHWDRLSPERLRKYQAVLAIA